MMCYSTGNTWLDRRLREVLNFYTELNTPACLSDPYITSKDREDIKKALARFEAISKRIHKKAKKDRTRCVYQIN